jgi:hypothetical protein
VPSRNANDSRPAAPPLLELQGGDGQWRHKEVELAAHDLLQYLDKRSG